MLLPSTIAQLRRESNLGSLSSLTSLERRRKNDSRYENGVDDDDDDDGGDNYFDSLRVSSYSNLRPQGLSYDSGPLERGSGGDGGVGGGPVPESSDRDYHHHHHNYQKQHQHQHQRHHRRARTMSGDGVTFADDLVEVHEMEHTPHPPPASPHRHRNHYHRRTVSAEVWTGKDRKKGERTPLLALRSSSGERGEGVGGGGSSREILLPPVDSGPRMGEERLVPIRRSSSREYLRTSSLSSISSSSLTSTPPIPPSSSSFFRRQQQHMLHRRTRSAQTLSITREDEEAHDDEDNVVDGDNDRHRRPKASTTAGATATAAPPSRGGRPPSSESTPTWEATEALHYKPIRSSGIGSSRGPAPTTSASVSASAAAAMNRHLLRRAKSAGSFAQFPPPLPTPSTSLLLEAYRQEALLGYGSISPASAAPASALPSTSASLRPEYRRSKTSPSEGGEGGGSLPLVTHPLRFQRVRLDSDLSAASATSSLGGGSGGGGGGGLPPVSPRTPRSRLGSNDSSKSSLRRFLSPPSLLPAVEPSPGGGIAAGRKMGEEMSKNPPPFATLSYPRPHSIPHLFDVPTAVVHDVPALQPASSSSSLNLHHHRRLASSSSIASAATAGTDMSMTSHRSDIARSSLFRGVTETGQVLMHLPMDNVRLVIDDTLEPGRLYKFHEPDEEGAFLEYHISLEDDLEDEEFFQLDDRLLGDAVGAGVGHAQPPAMSCACACDHCRMCRVKRRRLLPDVRYVIPIDDDLNRRVLSEIYAAKSLPCGLYYCMRDEHVGRPSVKIAGGIVVAVIGAMVFATVIWGGA